MAKFVLYDARIVAGAADLSCNSNTVDLAFEVEEQDATSFCSQGHTEVLGGLGSVTISAGGQWEADPVDVELWAQINGAGPVPWTIAPGELTPGSPAYSVPALPTTYSLLGDVGAVAPWEAEASGSGRPVRGIVEVGPTAVTASGTSVGRTVTAPTGGRVYVTLHVLALAPGASVQVTVERAADTGFESPTTVATSATYSAPGSEVLTIVPGADTAYRVSYTLTGDTPSVQFVAVIGAG